MLEAQKRKLEQYAVKPRPLPRRLARSARRKEQTKRDKKSVYLTEAFLSDDIKRCTAINLNQVYAEQVGTC